MNKRLIILGFIIFIIAAAGKFLFVISKNLKLDDFHKAAVIFLVDSTASEKDLSDEVQYLKTLCAMLDPEDAVKILKVSESSYLIYEGSASDVKGITGAIREFAKSGSKNIDPAYGEGIKKAVEHALTMKKEGYVPAIIVIGNLENKGISNKQINWETLPGNIENTKKYIPELTMMFLFAHPEKLDFVKTKLNPVLGEKKLIIANKISVDKVNTRFLKAIGR